MKNDNFYKKKNIDCTKLQSILCKANSLNIDYVDLYIQFNNNEKWILENGIIKNRYFNSYNGISLRCIKNDITTMISSNDINYNFIFKNISIIKNIFKEKNKINTKISINNKNNLINYNNIINIKNDEKIYILNNIYNLIKKNNKNIKHVNVNLFNSYDEIFIMNLNKSFIDLRPLTILKIFIVIEKNGKYSSGFSSIGIRSNFSKLNEKINNIENLTYIEKCINESINMALINLCTKEAPSGELPVVLGPGCPGVLLHEAVGHGLESDFIRKKTSIFYNKINKKIASKHCTVIDDGTMKNTNGSINIDDEGTKGKYNILIKNGILKKFMYDKYNANLNNKKSTGNGRRESYNKHVIPRMTNTYLLPGIHDPSDIINSINYGIYAISFTDGQVDITSGKFVFSTSVAFLIKNGKIKNPIKKITLIGSSIEIMNNISMIGNDFKMDLNSSICIKDNQSVLVSVGQPTIKIDNITVGGTK